MLRASLTPRALVPARALASRRARARPSHSSAAASVVSRSAADSIFSRSRFPRDGRARVVVSANAVSAPDAPLRPPAVPSHVIQLAAAVAAPAPAAPAKITLGLKVLLGGSPPSCSRSSPRASPASSSRCARWSARAARPPSRAGPSPTHARASARRACRSGRPSSRRTLCSTTPRFSAAAVRPSSKEITRPATALSDLLHRESNADGGHHAAVLLPGESRGPQAAGGAWVGGVRVEIGDVIKGERVGARWIGGKKGCNLVFDRANRFRVGEYCAVPRNDQTYTWGSSS